jgi:hypothetical protein
MSSSPDAVGSDRLSSQLATELDALIREPPVGGRFVVPPSADICASLELFLPRVLRRRYPEWEKESLDGIFVARATKTGTATAELAGTCILISDQTVTPFLVALVVVRTSDARTVNVARLMLGERGGGSLGISGPPCNSKDAQRLLASMIDRIDNVAWTYTFVDPDRGGPDPDRG